MGAIFDIPQARTLIKCNDVHMIVSQPDTRFPAAFSADENSTYRYAATNSIVDHNGRMDILVSATDPTTIPNAADDVGFGFIVAANPCVVPDGSSIFYGITRVSRAAMDSYKMFNRSALQTTPNGAQIGLLDSQFLAPVGVVLSVIVSNMFVAWNFNNLIYPGGTGFNGGPYSLTPSSWVPDGGPYPPPSASFRWDSTRVVVREKLIPVIFIKTAGITVKLLGVWQGEAYDNNFPLQP